jgi:hypothetical protein
MEAGLIDNSGTPTGATVTEERLWQPFMPCTKCSSLYEVWDGGIKHDAVPKDS